MAVALVVAVLGVSFWWGATKLGDEDDANWFAGFFFAWAVGGPVALLALAAWGWVTG